MITTINAIITVYMVILGVGRGHLTVDQTGVFRGILMVAQGANALII